MPAKKRSKEPEELASYKPTKKEAAALLSQVRRQQAEYVPYLKVVEKDGRETLAPDHPSEKLGWMLISESLGGLDSSLISQLVQQAAQLSSSGGKIDEVEINAILAFVRSQKPRDATEAMLSLQMAAVHSASMTFARRLAHVENIPQQDSAERAFNKLTRTYTTQMEALKRYRTGGEQKVTVQHVSVGQGGQAIVGNVTRTDREGAPPDEPLAITDAKPKPMPIIKDAKQKVASGGDE